ncbi:hypothetical protein [Pectobacterium versatile]|uniref:hypothetical protein n=1 Tax=Pectobacterium versatile TaxID=2488639 RepID=UPI0015DE4652|nr:hypothetical protein [Pectobacterium versatile]MBA0173851.1 hypothetical protein [Pectobacterium versatile]
MNFKLNREVINDLLVFISDPHIAGILKESTEEGEVKIKDIYPTGRYFIELSEQDVDIILDELSNAISNVGIGNDGEINACGIRIEKLIDIFNDI